MAGVQFAGGKCHGAIEAKAMLRHADKQERMIHTHSNTDIDITRTPLNSDLHNLSYDEMCAQYDDISDKFRAINAAEKATGTTKRGIRKDAVTLYDAIITVPRELPVEQQDAWFRDVEKTINEHYGRSVVLDIKIHRDEIHDYTDPATKRRITSRVHGHCFMIPTIDGEHYNAKEFSSRANMQRLNREIDAMSRERYHCVFLTGEKTVDRAFQSIEQLKRASDLAEQDRQIAEKSRQITAADKHLKEAKEQAEQARKSAQEAAQKAQEAQVQETQAQARAEQAQTDADEAEKRRKEASKQARETYDAVQEGKATVAALEAEKGHLLAAGDKDISQYRRQKLGSGYIVPEEDLKSLITTANAHKSVEAHEAEARADLNKAEQAAKERIKFAETDKLRDLGEQVDRVNAEAVRLQVEVDQLHDFIKRECDKFPFLRRLYELWKDTLFHEGADLYEETERCNAAEHKLHEYERQQQGREGRQQGRTRGYNAGGNDGEH